MQKTTAPQSGGQGVGAEREVEYQVGNEAPQLPIEVPIQSTSVREVRSNPGGCNKNSLTLSISLFMLFFF